MTHSRTAQRKRSHARQVRVHVHRERARRGHLARRARRARARRVRWHRAPWWYRHPLQFAALHHDIAGEYEHFRRFQVGNAVLFNGVVDVPETGARRRLTLIFSRAPRQGAPIVVVDGPTRSRHRYTWLRPTALCMWYSRDPPAMRWRLREGLTGLIDRARVHLLREAWWRTMASWPAPEVHREPNPPYKKTSQRTTMTYRIATRYERQRCWCGRGRYWRCHGAIDAGQELVELGVAPAAGPP